MVSIVKRAQSDQSLTHPAAPSCGFSSEKGTVDPSSLYYVGIPFNRFLGLRLYVFRGRRTVVDLVVCCNQDSNMCSSVSCACVCVCVCAYARARALVWGRGEAY